MVALQIERIPSGVKTIDDCVGGGFPRGRIIELYGAQSGGKSLIAHLIVSQAQKKGMECIYVDAENTFSPEFAKKIGVDTDKLILTQSSIGEDTIDLVCKLLDGNPGVIVVDSVAALITTGEIEEDAEKQFMAPKARLMSRGLSKMNTLNKDTLIIFVNQLRSTMAMYGPKTTTTGGIALGHYASVRMEVKKGDLIYKDGKKTGDVIGQTVNCYVTKNKTAQPYRRGSFQLLYEPLQII